MAEGAARDDAGDEWFKLSPSERAARIVRRAPEFVARQELLWSNLATVLDMEPAELDRRRNAIKSRVQRMANHLWSMWLEERQEALVESGAAGQSDELSIEDVARPIREQTEPHLIAAGVTESQAAAVRRLADRYPGVHLDAGGRRAYPMERVTVRIDRSTFPAAILPTGVDPEAAGEIEVTTNGTLTHVVGRMRELNRVGPGATLDTERRPLRNPDTGEIDLGHYREGDVVGGSGIEGSREDVLRGRRGRIEKRLDTGEVRETPASAGKDVRLTIDAMLQARVLSLLDPDVGFTVKRPWHKSTTVQSVKQADGSWALRPVPMGTPLNAAVVVLDVETSDVLAMVSSPSFTRAQVRERPESVFDDAVRAPWVNRAVSKPYAPGSIVKPMVLVAAVSSGVHRLHQTIECGGYLFPDKPNHYRDWIYKQYGLTFSDRFGRGLYGDEAIGVSSNIYFYTLGMRMGVDLLDEWYGRFGVGRTRDLGIGFEYPGSVGPKDRPAYQSDAILMGIGQGPVDWTPLHAADVYATLARMGTRIVPRIDRDAPIEHSQLPLDAAAVDTALDGLRYSVEHEWGTAHAFRYEEGGPREPIIDVPGVEVLGKTGTATAAAIVDDADGPDGPEPARVVRDGDHSWFVGLVSNEGQPPRYVVTVLVEYAGSGGRVSGPIAEQVIYALQAEGYL
jgi:cell division protein FtsI/penicillin-binding protein 2